MSLPIGENIVNPTEESREDDSTFQSILLTPENLESSDNAAVVPEGVDAVPLKENELLVQTIRDDDPSLYENDSYVEIGRKLISAKNSIELITISHGNGRKGPGWEGGNFQLDLLRINDENQASTDVSKSVILNNTNANVKANGHHVAWMDGAIVNGLPDDSEEISELVAVPEMTAITMSNHSLMEAPGNPFLNSQSENLNVLTMDSSTWKAIISKLHGISLEEDYENPDMGQGDSTVTLKSLNSKERPHHSRKSKKAVDFYSFIRKAAEFGSDDDLYSNDKPDDSKLLSVEGFSIPDAEFIAKNVSPVYHPLIKRNFKKDCRSWLHKNRSTQRRVHFLFDEISRSNLKR